MTAGRNDWAAENGDATLAACRARGDDDRPSSDIRDATESLRPTAPTSPSAASGGGHPVTDVTTTGPYTHFARPCGCPLTQADVQELKED